MSGFTSTVLVDRILWDDYENQTYPKNQCHNVRDQIVMVEGDKTVGIYERTLIKGTSKNGIVWHRWKTKKSEHFSVRSGRLESYSKSGRFFHTSTKGSFRWSDKTQVCAAINRLLLKNGLPHIEKFDSRAIFRASYPLFENWSRDAYRTIGLPHMNSNDMQEFTKKLFGKTRYRKDLVRAVASTTDPIALKNAYDMRGLVPIDWIIKYLQSHENRGMYYINRLKGIRAGFKNMSLNQRKAVVTALTGSDARNEQYHIEDLLDFAIQLPKETVQAVKMKPSNLYEVHTLLSMELTKIRYEDKEIEATSLAKRISDIDWSETGISMVPATSTHQVIDWGRDMNHCIGSYANQAAYGTYTLTGIYKDDTLIGNAMFDNKTCVQIFGKHNKHLPDEVLKSVIDELPNISFRNSWGIPMHLKNEAINKVVEQGLHPMAHLAPVPF